MADSGETAEASAAFRSLAAEFPRDGAIQEAYARLLSEQSDRESLATALIKWRALEKGSPAGAPRWFRAKYAIALVHYRLGDRRQAAKLITLLQLLRPDLGGPEMKRKFEDLLRDCR